MGILEPVLPAPHCVTFISTSQMCHMMTASIDLENYCRDKTREIVLKNFSIHTEGFFAFVRTCVYFY